MATLDVFRSNAFSVTSLTQSILKLPFKPARIGEMGLFQDKGINTTTAMIEEKNGLLSLIPTSARGGPATEAKRSMRKTRSFIIPHLALDDDIMASDIQNVRAFGSENELLTIAGLVNERMLEMKVSHEATLEWHRLGALHGVILDSDASTVIYDLFQEFGLGDSAGTNQAKMPLPTINGTGSTYTYGYTNGSSNTVATNDYATQSTAWAPEFGPGQQYLDIGAGSGLTSVATGGNRWAWTNTYGTSGLAYGQHGYVIPLSDPTLNIRSICIAIQRDIEKTLGMSSYGHIHAFCGANFFDKFVDHDDVRATYLNWLQAPTLRQDVRKGFEYGGIVWENYRGSVSGTLFQNANEAIIFPVGVPGLFQTYYAPADFMETANTIGVPLYAKQAPDYSGLNRFVKIHTQSNPLPICNRPLSLVKACHV